MKLNNKGVTLVELMVGTVLFLLITGGMIEVFSSSNQLYQNTIQQAKVVTNANIALEVIAEELKMSDITSTTPQKVEYKYHIYKTTDETVVFEKDESRSIYYDSANKTIIFAKNDVPYDTIKIRDVSSLNFSNDIVNKICTVTITFNASGKKSDQVEIKSSIKTGEL